VSSIKTEKEEAIRISGEWLFYLDKKLILKDKNLLVTSGLNYLASLLVNEKSNDMSVYLAYGTGVTPAADGDTTLGSESGRKIVSTKTRSGATALIRSFFLASEANGTWSEFGLFLAGTEGLNSGTLLNRILPIGGILKSASTVLTIEVRIVFAAT
jgi:hypothetical protein